MKLQPILRGQNKEPDASASSTIDDGELRRLPVISIITATRNSAETVAQALDSVAGQTYTAIERVWVDGASTDGTVEILLARKERGPKTLVSEPDKGIYDALNKGLHRSTGDIIGFLHADDLLADKKVLARIASAFEDPRVGAVYGDLEYVNRSNTLSVLRYWHAGEFRPKSLAKGWMPPHPTLYLRREIFEEMGGFDPSYRISADYELVLRVFSHPRLFPVYLQFVQVKMRVGGLSNRSLSNILRKTREDFRALRRHGIPSFPAVACKNLGKIMQFFKRASVPTEAINSARVEGARTNAKVPSEPRS